jgi:hypothetical protein
VHGWRSVAAAAAATYDLPKKELFQFWKEQNLFV